MGNQKLTGRAVSIPKAVMIGNAVCVIAMSVVIAVTAHMISSEILQQNSIGYCAILALVLGSGVGAWTAAVKAKRLKIQVVAIHAVLCFLELLGLNFIIFKGSFQGCLVTLVSIIFGSIGGGLLSSVDQPRKRRKKNIGKLYKISRA